MKVGKSYAQRGKYTSVECRFPSLTVEIDKKKIADQAAKAAAEAVIAGIRDIGEHSRAGHPLFVNTGTLVNGIAGAAGEVTAPPDRLEDPALLDRLTAAVPALREPENDKRVTAAVDRAADRAVT